MIRSTFKFHKHPDKFSKEELNLTVTANLLEFLAQLDCICFDTWDIASNPIENRLGEFVMKRGPFRGRL